MSDRVLSGEKNIAHDIPMLSVLCFSIAHWEKLVNDFDAFQAVQFLNTVQVAFDKHKEQQKVHQVRTSASFFMVTAGQDGDTFHAETLLKLALNILDEVESEGLKLHFALHSGSALAGVVGSQRPNYCFFGDTLQYAQAMVARSPPGCLCLSDSTHSQLGLLSGHHRLPAGARVIEHGKVELLNCKSVKLWLLVPSHVPEEAILEIQAAPAPAVLPLPAPAAVAQPHVVTVAVPQLPPPPAACQVLATDATSGDLPLTIPQAVPPVGGWRLLSVDDDEVNQEVVTGIFKPEGLNITIAMNGAECLKEVDKGSFHIVLLDSMMPGMSGLEVCKQLRKRFTHLELPIIMLTCRTAAEEAAEAIDAGCNDYVRKPFTRVELVARVHVHLAMRHERNALQKQIRDVMAKAQSMSEIQHSAKPTSRHIMASSPPPPPVTSQLNHRAASSPNMMAALPNTPGERSVMSVGSDYRSGDYRMNGFRTTFTDASVSPDAVGEIKELRDLLRDQERAFRAARVELVACRAKLAASEGDADEVWHRLSEAELSLMDFRQTQMKMQDAASLAKLGLSPDNCH